VAVIGSKERSQFRVICRERAFYSSFSNLSICHSTGPEPVPDSNLVAFGFMGASTEWNRN